MVTEIIFNVVEILESWYLYIHDESNINRSFDSTRRKWNISPV